MNPRYIENSYKTILNSCMVCNYYKVVIVNLATIVKILINQFKVSTDASLTFGNNISIKSSEFFSDTCLFPVQVHGHCRMWIIRNWKSKSKSCLSRSYDSTIHMLPFTWTLQSTIGTYNFNSIIKMANQSNPKLKSLWRCFFPLFFLYVLYTMRLRQTLGGQRLISGQISKSYPLILPMLIFPSTITFNCEFSSSNISALILKTTVLICSIYCAHFSPKRSFASFFCDMKNWVRWISKRSRLVKQTSCN